MLSRALITAALELERRWLSDIVHALAVGLRGQAHLLEGLSLNGIQTRHVEIRGPLLHSLTITPVATHISGTMLDVANLLFDSLFYDAHVRSRQTSQHQWPLGQPQRAATNLCRHAPLSVMNEISEFCSHPGNRTSMPLLKPTAIKFSMISDAWQKVLEDGGLQSDLGKVPISTVEHETGQLEWNRPGVPICASKSECEALNLAGAPGALPVYLSSEEQRHFEETGEVPIIPRFCLLCIRRDAHALSMLQASLPSTTKHTGRAGFVLPPFLNLVDVPGGYRSNAFCKPVETSRIVALSGQLSVRHCPLREKWYIDQGNIVFGAPLNPLATV